MLELAFRSSVQSTETTYDEYALKIQHIFMMFLPVLCLQCRSSEPRRKLLHSMSQNRQIADFMIFWILRRRIEIASTCGTNRLVDITPNVVSKICECTTGYPMIAWSWMWVAHFIDSIFVYVKCKCTVNS